MSEVAVARGSGLVAECYAPASEASNAAEVVGRVSAACHELDPGGAAIEYLGALVVPGDELAYHIFGGADANAVSQVARRAGLRVERVVPAMAIGWPVRPAWRRSLQALPVSVEADRPVGHATGEIGP